jgi:ABC-type phosphate transport system substrate-binding protein
LQLLRMIAAIGFLVAAATASATAGDVSGAGATFPYPIYAKWADAYKKQTGIAVNYQPVGSGEGIKQIQNKEVTFGASDMPLKAADLDMYGLVQFPTVIGGVVAVVNVDGVKAGDLTLDGPTLARIFLGEIKSWNDAALRRLNPSVKLPSQPIAVVHRSDGSGTTFVFTDYLSKMSADWRSKVGSITAVDWPVGTGARGNEGVAAMVARIKGAIGYVEYAYAKHNQLSTTKLMNKGRQGGRSHHRVVHGRCPQRQLGSSAWLRRHPYQRIRCRYLADDQRHLRPHAQAAERSGGGSRSAEILQLGLRQGRQDGGGTRLRADAEQRGQRGSEVVGVRDQGCRRQADFRAFKLMVEAPRRRVAPRTGFPAVQLGFTLIHNGLGCHPTVIGPS